MLLFKQVEIPDFDLGVDFVDTLTGGISASCNFLSYCASITVLSILTSSPISTFESISISVT